MNSVTVLCGTILLVLLGTACGTTGASGNSQQAGEQLFNKLECNGCHVYAAGQAAPPLAGVYGNTVTLDSGEAVMVDESYLRESILSPQVKVVSGYQPIMPSYEGRVSDEQIDLLEEYIKSLGSE